MIPKKRHIILIIIILSGITSNLFSQELKFKSLTVENGLSNNDVNTVVQDKAGFIWFGTEDGLNRYDGYSFKVFRHDSNDSTSISDNIIWALTTDKKGKLWVGTKGGYLNKYNPEKDKFTHIKIKSNTLAENSIKTIYEDSKGNIWIGSYKEGLYRFNQTTQKIDHWVRDKNNPKSLSHNYILSILEDINGKMIIGTYNGLSILDPNNLQNGFEVFYNEKDNETSLSSNLIWQLTKSPFDPNIIWISTHNNITKFNSTKKTFKRIKIPNPNNLQYGTSAGYIIEEKINGQNILLSDSYSGLIRINLTSGITNRFLHSNINTQSIISNQINKILKDRSGVLWLATEQGISFSTPKSSLFNSVEFAKNVSSINKKNITALTKVGVNKLVIGTGDGIYTINYHNTESVLKKIPKLDKHHIWALAKGNKNEIWIGTYGKGLKKYNLLNNKLKSYNLRTPKTNSDAALYIKSLLSDKKGFVWIGFWGIGIARLNPMDGNFEIWMNEPEYNKSLSHNDVWTIEEDNLGRIWLGTQGGGLNLFEDKNGGIFHHWLKDENSENSLSSNNINCIMEAQQNYSPDTTILWIGTSNGLNKCKIINRSESNVYNFDTEIKSFTIENGLKDNIINSIVEDSKGNLWLGTDSGISFFDKERESFVNFNKDDGVIGIQMNPDAALKLSDELILIGSSEGLTVFNPKTINRSNFKPKLVFTDFQIFNQSQKVGKNSPLKKSLINTNEIELTHDQNVFSFEFAALDYNSPQSVKYAHKLEGFDKDWIESGNRRFVTYTNLDPGDYIFKVRSTNADGLWNDNIAFMKVVITPPWWQSLWAYGIYFALIVIGLYAIRRFELNRTKLRNELKLKEIEVKQKSELEEIKSRFFANLSHEFRTPLLLIKGPLEQIKKGKDKEENIDLIEKNSERLKSLIDQLLELSQLEKASVPLKARKLNIVTTLKGIISTFESLAKQKNIQLTLKKSINDEIFWIDKDKFEKIIINLFSNAFKFTPDFGKVEVSINEKSENGKSFAELIISDSGISIPQDKIDKIFDRFYQVDDTSKRTYGGSGIGLALVKEFIELHKWNISVKSDTGKGTEFKIEIPYGDEHLSNDEKISMGENLAEQRINQEIVVENIQKNIELNPKKNNDKKSILIVDDSEDVRKYLKSLLIENFSISEADNGESGIKKAAEILPDLILSDVMMPSMDGLEFCSKIKSEWQTSDIPVILLTAKASFESKLEGLEIGADDYLTKPFDSRELFTRIKNLIDQRERLRKRYVKAFDTEFEKDKINLADKEFIEKVISSIKKNIDKTNFNTDQLAKELFMSRTKLHRKVHQITGQAPGEFIRNFKLKKAANLLLENKLSVTQIAYEIGFSSPAQFTRAFGKQYNCLPSEFLSNYKN